MLTFSRPKDKRKTAWILKPSYSPELNPDEYLNRDVKGHLSETKVPRTADELTRTVQTHLEKKDKASVKRLFHKPEVRYAAENEKRDYLCPEFFDDEDGFSNNRGMH